MKTNFGRFLSWAIGRSLLLVLCIFSFGAKSPAQFFSPDRPSEALVRVDRQGLIDLMDAYLLALAAHDPSGIPFAGNVRFVENIDRKPVGEGLWQTASAPPSAFKIYVPDPAVGEVGFMGMMQEKGQPVMIAVRLKVTEGLVSEAEHLVVRNPEAKNMKYLQTVRPGILSVVAEKERMKRYEILGIAYSYYDALIMDNGYLAPMAEDSARRENGMPASNSGIPDSEAGEWPNYSAMKTVEQLNTNMMDYIDDIDNVRVFAVDTTTGLAMGFSHFRHGMKRPVFPIYHVPGVETREVSLPPFDLPAAHVYKIYKGEIHEIEALGFLAGYMSSDGWE
ncbi:MAG: hypothetical protein LBD89_08585 [Tannerellaceae bacterium]|jgi:hypothetical protein|nr:hypothetical protein [Tannerellaceae bacterium]